KPIFTKKRKMAGDWLIRTVYRKYQTEWFSLSDTPLLLAHLLTKMVSKVYLCKQRNKSGW
ncbi:hypothetical protein, partial [Oenococcus oeni]|uniref:hypothetical protein n=1 Tax=Oenococcus oeni TaxID=1247 RepID=UPI001C5BC536